MVIITMAMVLLLIGELFTVGPKLLQCILGCLAAIKPVSMETTVFLSLVLMFIILFNWLYKKTYKVPKPNSDIARKKMRRKRAVMIRVTSWLHFIAIISVLLIAMNKVFIKWNEEFSIMLRTYEDVFAILFYVGIIFVATGSGICIGWIKRGTQEKKKIHYRSETITTPEEDYEQNITDINGYGQLLQEEIIVDEAEYFRDDQETLHEEVNEDDLDVHLPNSAVRKLR